MKYLPAAVLALAMCGQEVLAASCKATNADLDQRWFLHTSGGDAINLTMEDGGAVQPRANGHKLLFVDAAQQVAVRLSDVVLGELELTTSCTVRGTFESEEAVFTIQAARLDVGRTVMSGILSKVVGGLAPTPPVIMHFTAVRR